MSAKKSSEIPVPARCQRFTIPVVDETLAVAHRVARLKYLGPQPNVPGKPPIQLYNVVGDAIVHSGGVELNYKDSTTTIAEMERRGFKVEIMLARADLTETERPGVSSPRARFDEALLAAEHQVEENDWRYVVPALEMALHLAHVFAAEQRASEAGVVPR